jgi:hypothetical protein
MQRGGRSRDEVGEDYVCRYHIMYSSSSSSSSSSLPTPCVTEYVTTFN